MKFFFFFLLRWLIVHPWSLGIQITYIIVQKRNHVRVAPIQEGRQPVADQKGNPMPGLVIDSDIVSPRDWYAFTFVFLFFFLNSLANHGLTVDGFLREFYLVSHTALKGTSCIPRYTVLIDEAGYSNNQVGLSLCSAASSSCLHTQSAPLTFFFLLSFS
jgi:hypothetical protein